MNAPLHICLSGNPACSGINPCDACHQVYTARILPKAMVAGGFNGSHAQAALFFQAYALARKEVLHTLAAHLQAEAPTLNGASPPDEVSPLASEPEPWQGGGQIEEGTGTLTDDEVARMAAPPPHDFAPEPDEDPGMPDEDRAKEVAQALLKGAPLTPKASPPPAGPEAGETSPNAPRRTKKTKTTEATANKE